jgi:hypothetical protein
LPDWGMVSNFGMASQMKIIITLKEGNKGEQLLYYLKTCFMSHIEKIEEEA